MKRLKTLHSLWIALVFAGFSMTSCSEQEEISPATQVEEPAAMISGSSFSLFTGLNSGNGPAVYKSQASNIGTKIYQGSTFWTVKALASGSASGAENLFIGFNGGNGPAIYKGNGTNVGTKIYQGSTFWNMQSLTAD